MKKILLFLVCSLIVDKCYSQIISINENWPNPNWTIGGTYTPAALTSNPLTGTNLSYDTALVSPVGATTFLFASSPFFSLVPAFNGNEKSLKIQFNVAFTTYTPNSLYVQFWNADSSTWNTFPDGAAPVQTVGDYTNCSSALPVSIFFDFSSLTTNQLQNFKYRFVIDGTSSNIGGVCLNNVTLSTFSCLPVSNFNVLSTTFTSATFTWTNSDPGVTYYDFQYGLQGFALGTGNMQQTSSTSSPPFTISGLQQSTAYDIYIRKDCSDGNQSIFSSWTGPVTFVTGGLGVSTFISDDFKLYPNPVKNALQIDSKINIREVEIDNMSGQELIHQLNDASSTTIDLSGLSAGLYFVKIHTDLGSGIYKIVKN